MTTEDFISQELEDFSEFLPDAEALKSIAGLVQKQLDLEGQVDALEERLKGAKAALKKVQEDLLPNAMAEAGTSSFRTREGINVEVKQDLSVSVPKKNMSEICAWLRENGYGELIKEGVDINLAGISEDKKKELFTYCVQNGIGAELTSEVHTASLKSVLRKKIEAGEDFDLKKFGAFPWRKSILTQ